MESFAAIVLDGLSPDTAMPRLVVDVLSTAGEPAGCWFHHGKATPPELQDMSQEFLLLEHKA